MITFIAFIIVFLVIGLPLLSYGWRNFYPKKQRCYGFEIPMKKAEEIALLQKDIRITNKYCKELVTTLFLSIDEKLPMEVKKAQPKNVLLFCENIVLRKLNYMPDLWGDEMALMQVINNRDLCKKIKRNAFNIVKPITGEETESFYIRNADAWQIRYEHLINSFNPRNVHCFYTAVCKLAELNSCRINVERRIYTKSFQFLVKIDREYSLRLYIGSLCSNTPKISARNRKILFRNKQEEEAFDRICMNVMRQDRPGVLEKFEKLNITQRKKISLNTDAIRDVAKKQTKVAEVLSELLADEEELPVTKKVEPIKQQPQPSVTPANNHVEALFRLFITNSFRINKEELDIFVRPYGLFPSQCIEQINDTYFEELDDVLIEEESDSYIMNQDYYRQIEQHGN